MNVTVAERTLGLAIATEITIDNIMTIVKKLKYTVGDEEIVIKISLDSKGMFSADIPPHIKKIVQNAVCGIPTMHEALESVSNIIGRYRNAVKTEERFILVKFSAKNDPVFLNTGISLELNYAIVDKVVTGEHVTYKYVHKGMDGKYCQPGNEIRHSSLSHLKNGVDPETAVEIPFSEEKLATIETLHAKLKTLSEALSALCNTSEGIEKLMTGVTGMLLGESR